MHSTPSGAVTVTDIWVIMTGAAIIADGAGASLRLAAPSPPILKNPKEAASVGGLFI
jgi:hypothetical protein